MKGKPSTTVTQTADIEPHFDLLGRDRHAAALVELWAYMREKEGEDPDSVASARTEAAAMRTHGTELGRPMLSFDSLVTLAASLVHDREAERVEKARMATVIPPVEEGDLVTSSGPVFNGQVGRVVKVFADSVEQPALNGLVNVEYGRPPVTRTISVGRLGLRKATDVEAASSGLVR